MVGKEETAMPFMDRIASPGCMLGDEMSSAPLLLLLLLVMLVLSELVTPLLILDASPFPLLLLLFDGKFCIINCS